MCGYCRSMGMGSSARDPAASIVAQRAYQKLFDTYCSTNHRFSCGPVCMVYRSTGMIELPSAQSWLSPPYVVKMRSFTNLLRDCLPRCLSIMLITCGSNVTAVLTFLLGLIGITMLTQPQRLPKTLEPWHG